MPINKTFGQHRANDEVVGGEDLKNLYVSVASAEELTSISTHDGVVCTANFKVGATEYRSGDVLIRVDGAWVKLTDATFSLQPNQLGNPTKLRGYRLGGKVYIKWNDPVDQKDVNRRVTNMFMKSILVRKFGGTPQNMFDGTPVCTETVKNSFSKEFFVDSIPTGTDQEPHYRVFTIATNGYVSASCKKEGGVITPDDLVPGEFTWGVISRMIQNGEAHKVFAVGDVVTLDNGEGDSTNLLVLDIDGDTCGVDGTDHSVQFLMNQLTIGGVQRELADCFDTREVVVVDGSKYIKSVDVIADDTKVENMAYLTPIKEVVSGEEVIVGFSNETQPAAGSDISDAGLYERFTGYSWKDSTLREMLNDPSTGLIHELRTISPEFADIIVNTTHASRTPSGVEHTSDKFVLPSLYSVFGVNNVNVVEGVKQYEYLKGVSTYENIMVDGDEVLNTTLAKVENLMEFLDYDGESSFLLRSVKFDGDNNKVFAFPLPSSSMEVTEGGVDVGQVSPVAVVFSIGYKEESDE